MWAFADWVIMISTNKTQLCCVSLNKLASYVIKKLVP